MSTDHYQRYGFGNPFGFGSLIPPGSTGWVPTPLYTYPGTYYGINLINDAPYGNQSDANGATGAHEVRQFASLADFQAQLAAAGNDRWALWRANQPWAGGRAGVTPVDPPPRLPPQRSSEAHPDLAVMVRAFYSKYLHRSGSQVDDDGLDFWVTGSLNADGPKNVELAFRVQAVNDGVYTEATLPAPQYFTITTPPPPVDDPDDGPADTGDVPPITTTPPVTAPGAGMLDGIQDTISGWIDSLEESTGLSRGYIEAGAVVAGLGVLWYLNSGSGSSRSKR